MKIYKFSSLLYGFCYKSWQTLPDPQPPGGYWFYHMNIQIYFLREYRQATPSNLNFIKIHQKVKQNYLKLIFLKKNGYGW